MSSVHGVIPATLLPFQENQSIDEEGYRKHLAELAEYDAIHGVLSNGHAGESYALTPEERARVVEIADEATGDKAVYSGVVGATTKDVIEDAKRVERAGADAVMVDAPNTPITGRRKAAVQFYEAVTDAVEVPVVLFQISSSSGRNYSPELLAELASIDGIVAIKEGVWDVDHTQEDVLALRERDLDVNYLMGNDEHLLPCYAFGVDGTVVELAAALPQEIISLYEAVQEGNMSHAQEIHERLAPFLDVVYQDPKHDSSIRLKVALELQGRLPSSVPRKPALPVPESEVEQIKEVMEQTDLL